MTEFAIEAHQLHKSFSPPTGWRFWQPSTPKTVVETVSLQVPRGSCFGLLGVNGAGKTTLAKMLATLILPTSGTAVITGYPLSESASIRANVGMVVTDERSFYWRLTAEQNLRFFAALHGLHGTAANSRIQEVLKAVQLEAEATRPFRFFSSGMKQRLAIARALLHRPQLLFLDEPSRSLDPNATQQLHTLLTQLNNDGITLFLITHDLAEAESLCQSVALMDHGSVQAIGSPHALRQQIQADKMFTLSVDRRPKNWPAHLPSYEWLESTHGQLSFQSTKNDDSFTAVLDHLRHEQITIHDVASQRPSLAHVFAKLTNQTVKTD